MSDRITYEKEVADLREQLAAAQSREVCTVAHSDEVMEFCPYCKIERLRGDLSETRIALANAECREGVAKARLADRDLDAECYHHLCGLIRANPNAAAGEVLDWFKGDAARAADSAGPVQSAPSFMGREQS